MTIDINKYIKYLTFGKEIIEEELRMLTRQNKDHRIDHKSATFAIANFLAVDSGDDLMEDITNAKET